MNVNEHSADFPVYKLDCPINKMELLANIKEGSIIKIGNVKLEVRQETAPCEMMEKVKTGLFEALEKNWRGGVCCKVIEPGHISIGDDVQII